MKNIIFRAAAIVCLLATTLGITSCQKDSDLEGATVELYAFGPTPVLRGEEIIFKGKGLDKVTEIILPDNISITEFNSACPYQISITIPQEAVTGYVTLNFPGGSITTKTLLGFEEPFVINSIAPVDTQVRAGDEITIKGDYLNNIAKVVFGGEAAVEMDAFTAQSRYEIKLNLPAEAISGKLYVVDSNDNQLYSDEELSVMQPTISSIAPLMIKAGENLTIKGENLDLAASVEFGGGLVVEEFVSQSENEVVVASPATMLEGAITLTSKAGQAVVSDDALECVVPSAITVAATDRYKAGSEITISGDDLDLVTAVQFAGSAAASEFTLNGKITTTIPVDAVDGVLTLSTAAGKGIESPAIELVKPVAVSLESIDIISGESIIVHGKDFDLVTSVTLAGAEMEFVYDATSGDITVATSRETKSGDLKFITANGNNSHIATITVTLDSIVKVSSMPESAAAGEKVTIEGESFNKIESMSIGTAKVTDYIARADNSITFVVPEVEAGVYNLTFNLTTGEVETSVGTITVGAVITRVDIWSGEITITDWGSTQDFAWKNPSPFADMPSGATLVFEFTQTGGGETQLKLCNPDGWSVLPGPSVNDWGVITGFTTETTSYSYAFADSEIEVFKTKGIVISGQHFTLTALYYTY